MAKQIDTKLLNFISTKKSVDIKTLQKEFDLKRTTLLHRLNTLEEYQLIKKYKAGKKMIYQVTSMEIIESFFNLKISEIQETLVTFRNSIHPNSIKNKKIVAVADDFGFVSSVNKGIIDSYNKGFITEVSLMLRAPGTDEAIKLITDNKIDDVGLHLNLNDFEKTGIYKKKHDYENLFRTKSFKQIEDIVLAEIKLFETKLKKKPTHIAPHKGMHGNLKVLKAIIKYANKFTIPIRIPKSDMPGTKFEDQNYTAEIMLKRNKIRTTDYLLAYVKGTDIDQIKEKFFRDIKKVKMNESVELMLHPGYFDEELQKYTSLTFERPRDLALTLDKKFKEQIKNLGFKFVSYSKI